ncbi:MAG: DUF4351 domain-containing protein [Symploca sp. SIO2E6]|nr:DUF4351 domain-containing protein [Symploca sp. SIO2E6]
MEALGEMLFDFESEEDLRQWLRSNEQVSD